MKKQLCKIGIIFLLTLLAAPSRAQENTLIKAAGAMLSHDFLKMAPAAVNLTRMLPVTLAPVGGIITHEMNYNIGGLGKAEVLPVRMIPATKGLYVDVGYDREMYVPGPFVDYIPYFYQLRSSASLRKVDFPALFQKNEDLLKASLKNSMQHVSAVQKNDALFYSSLRSEVMDGTVPYHRFFPAKAMDYVYVGEVHYNPRIEEELLNLLQFLKLRYPSRHLYLATEYAWESRSASTLDDKLPLAIARDKQGLRKILENDYANTFFLHKTIEMGIPVVGLEPRIAMAKEAAKHTGATDPARIGTQMQRLSLSEVGLDMRNDRWVEHIRQIREQDPQALIVVHGGAQHTTLHNLVSVSNKIGGDVFSMMLLDWRAKEITNPILGKLDDQNFLWNKFENTPDGKYIISFKDANPSVGRTAEKLEKFRKALGADLVIFLKDLSPMIIP